MLELTESQGRILETFIEYDGDKYGDVGYGLTSGILEKLGISRQTFDKKDKERKYTFSNKEYLLKKYLIRKTFESKHGRQIWQYFWITQLGVLAYLKWKSNKSENNSITITRSFFPLITNHLKPIQKLYGDAVILLLLDSAKKINVMPQSTLKTFDGKKKIEIKKLTMSMALPMGAVDLVLYQNLGEPRFLLKKSGGTDKTYDDSPNIELNKKIVDWYTFTFYYNLINLHRDLPLISHIMWQFDPFFTFKDDKVYTKDLKEYEQKFRQFHNRMIKNTDEVIDIINEDSLLHKLFKDNIIEIDNILNSRKIFQFLKEKIK